MGHDFFPFAKKKRSHETHWIIKQVTGIKLDTVYLPWVFGQNTSENGDNSDQTALPTDSDQGLHCLKYSLIRQMNLSNSMIEVSDWCLHMRF